MKKQFKLMLGDNMESLKKLPDNSIDSIVSDPPYGLSAPKNSGKTSQGGFMGKKWDYDVPTVDFWKEVYRVLKPGGHVLSFGGTRTYHRMVVNIEDAGFEIRDQVMWIYGSGFPKSHNIGKAVVDKIEGNEREVVGKLENYQNKSSGGANSHMMEDIKPRIDIDLTKGSSPYEGWGTALKPANEPICVARKPLSEKSVAENVLKWGTGGINIDGCRIEGTTKDIVAGERKNGTHEYGFKDASWQGNNEGRFPANIILECICDEVIRGEKGEVKENGGTGGIWSEGSKEPVGRTYNDKGDIHTNPMCPCYQLDEQSGNNSNPYAGQSGGASRFFYVAKVSKKERNLGLDNFEETTTDTKGHGIDRVCMNEGCGVSMLKPELCKCEEPDWRVKPKKNNHPTLKPINLMTYLCRLVTPEGGIVLDPFMGSGSTGIAACLEGFRFVGMEMNEEYFKIAEARITSYEQYKKLLK